MRVSRSALWLLPALLLSLVTANPLGAQSSPAGLKSKSGQDSWDAPTQTAPQLPGSGSGAGKADKNVSDGAAKGQASEGVYKPQDSTSPRKNLVDGAAKGQATDSVYKPHDSASPSKNISDGAAKGQATEGVFKPHDSSSPSAAINGQGSGTGERKTVEHPMGEMKSKSGYDDWTAPTSTAAPPKSGGKSSMDDWTSQTKTAPPPNSGSTKSKSAQDDWTANARQAPGSQPQTGTQPSGSGKVSKNISDGAAKGQATELTAPNPNGGTQVNGQSDKDKMESKSAQDSWDSPR